MLKYGFGSLELVATVKGIHMSGAYLQACSSQAMPLNGLEEGGMPMQGACACRLRNVLHKLAHRICSASTCTLFQCLQFASVRTSL